MQNRTAIWIFTILLALACLYSLSFSFFTGNFEKKAYSEAEYALDSVETALGRELNAAEHDSVIELNKRLYIRKNGNEKLIPFLGYTYADCQAREIKEGLDLKGGMSVTLEVSIPDLVINLADHNKSKAFTTAIEKAKAAQLTTTGKNFIELFSDAWSSENEQGKLWNVFHTYNNKDKFPVNSTDERVIEILTEESNAAVSNTEKILRTRIDQFGVTQPTIQRQQFTDRILVELPGAKDKERVRKIITGTANLEFWEVYENGEIGNSLFMANTRLGEHYYPDYVAKSDQEDAETTLDSLGNVIDDAVADIDDLNEDSADADDFDTDEEISREDQLKQSPLMAFLIPNLDETRTQFIQGPVIGYTTKESRDTVLRMLNNPVVQDLFPASEKMKFSFGANETGNGFYPLYALKVTTKNGQARLDGNSIVDARQDFEPFSGNALVSMSMNPQGAKIWKAMTAEASSATPKQCIAVVLDNAVYSAPQVNGEIPNGNSQITMGTDDPEQGIRDAVDLANLLKAGALPAPANIVDEQIIGSTIGDDNRSKGLMSFGIALGVILLFMILYYSGAGGISDIALIANMFFLMGALVSLGASLTLPGIAGIILTIGMAVDANVLIFERVKEELRNGAGKQAAVKKGYQKAYSAILDANITTFLTAVVLFLLGSGPIKGFATTLMIGIVTSLFSAIFITRLIISWRLDAKKDVSFYTSMTKNLFTNLNFDFIGKRKIFYVISAVIILGGAASLFTNGLDLGVDFAGGRTYDIEFNDQVNVDDVRKSLDNAFVDANGNAAKPSVKTIGGSGKKVRITTKFRVDDTSEGVDSEVDAALVKGLEGYSFDQDNVESKKVDPTISDDFQSSSRWAIFFSLLFIFLYIVFRFKKKEFGIGALVAMAHDVLVVLGIFSLFYKFLPFSMEIDQAFIAAILTVVGYSINDTVVVFDRLREYLNESRKGITNSVINSALNSTLSRTVMTSFSTFIVLLMIFVFGGDSIKGFTFALMIGVIVGTYSSLCIATPLVVDLSKKSQDD